MKTLKKTRITSFMLAVILILPLILLVANTQPKQVVSAENLVLDDTQEIGMQTGEFYLLDENLYNALLNIYNANFVDSITTLTAGSFKSFTSLDLSGKGITNLTGMQYFNLPNLTHLNFSNNQIAGGIRGFYNITAVTHLDFSNNQLEFFDTDFSTVLENLNLKNNKLTECDILTVAENANVDLSFNNLSSFDKLTLPAHNININLTHNSLTAVAPVTTYNLNLGYQGPKNEGFAVKGSSIKFYGLQDVTQVDIYKKQGEEYNKIDTLTAGEELANLTLGYYKIEFIEAQTPKVYEDITFTARPDAPTVEFWQGETKLASNTYKIDKPTQVKIIGEGTVKYSLDYGKTVVEKAELTLDTYGTYTIQVWVVEDGIESEKVLYAVTSNYVPPMTFVWLILSSIVLIGLFYAGYLFKNYVTRTKTISGKVNKGFE